jgi:hypothetical protein
MSFELTTQHIHDYHTNGFVIFADLIPAELLRRLRQEADKGREIARSAHGATAQRLQPIKDHPEVDMAPFEELARLPALVEGLNGLFEVIFGHAVDTVADFDQLGILYEPSTSPWCMRWHRDFRDLHAGVDFDKWQARMHDVPGSHLRNDTPEEIRRFPNRPIDPPPWVESKRPEEAEQMFMKYAKSMPGAQQIHLNAGDYMLYRNTLWHVGLYVPYQKRATIHGAIMTPEYESFMKREFIPVVEDQGAHKIWENPNAERTGIREARVGASLRRLKHHLKILTSPKELLPRLQRRFFR